MKPINRRKFVITAGGAAAGCLVLGNNTFAAWPQKAYKQDGVDNTLQALYGTTTSRFSDQISIKVPEIAENGAVVPITIDTSLPDVESISVLVEKNPNPLVATFNTLPNNPPRLSTRIKIGERSDVLAVVKSKGELYVQKKFVKVTIGGCGGGGDSTPKKSG